MNPGQPLFAAAERAARKELKREQQLGEGAALVGQHDPGAQHGAAHTKA